MAKKFTETAVGSALSSVPVVGNIAGGLINAVGGIFGAKAEAKQQRKTMEYQYELNQKSADAQLERDKSFFDHQNAANQENWEAQNEYNSPENQRKRLEQAGMHATAAGGAGLSSSMSTIDSAHGGANAGLGVSALGSTGPTSNMANIAGSVKNISQSVLQGAQYYKEIANTDLLEQQFISEGLKQKVLAAEEQLKLAQGDKEGFLAQIAEAEADVAPEMVNTKMREINASINQMEASLDEIASNVYRNYRAGDLSRAEYAVAMEQVNKLKTAQALDQANTCLSYAYAALAKKDAALRDVQIDLTEFNSVLAQMDIFKRGFTDPQEIQEGYLDNAIKAHQEHTAGVEAKYAEERIKRELANTRMDTITGYTQALINAFGAFIDLRESNTHRKAVENAGSNGKGGKQPELTDEQKLELLSFAMKLAAAAA